MPIPSSHVPGHSAPGARRATLLALLRERESPMSVAEVASEIGLHPNTVRAHLEVLTREGKVERTTERRASRGRPREIYAATGAPEADESYAQLAAVLAAQLESLGGAAPAIEAGKRWARWEQPADDGAPGTLRAPAHHDPSSTTLAKDEVLTVLRRTGFAPELGEDGVILLRHCPFGPLAREHTEVVCGAHLGLIQGTLDRVSPGARAELTPFVAPGVCRAEVVAASARPPATPGAPTPTHPAR